MGLSLPFYKLLSSEDLKQIDLTGRRILEKIGIRILDTSALDTLKKAGAYVDVENQRVRFESDWLGIDNK